MKKSFNKFIIALALVGLSAGGAANAQTWNIGSPTAAAVTATISGSGTNLTLTINGTGAMQDFTLGTIPWYSIKDNIKTLVINSGITSIGSSAFRSCSSLTGALTIPNSVTSIGYDAFAYCSGLTGVLTIPNSVTSIGNDAFYDCTGFTGALTIPNSVTSIGDYAFRSCISLTSLTIGNSVTYIGDYAFFYCSGLTGALTIPNSVTSIGYAAFYGCTGFTSLTIGNSVTSIEDYVFYNCSGLTSVTNLNPIPQVINSNVFSGVAISSCVLKVPAGTVSAYQAADVWKEFIIQIATGIDNIEANQLSIYPNPVNYELRIMNYEFGVENYSIIDMTGKVVMHGKLEAPFNSPSGGKSYSETTINISSLSQGVYFIKTGNKTGKFVKE